MQFARFETFSKNKKNCFLVQGEVKRLGPANDIGLGLEAAIREQENFAR